MSVNRRKGEYKKLKTQMVVETMEIGGIVLDAEFYTRQRVGHASEYRFRVMREEEGFPGPVVIGGKRFYERRAVDGWIARRVYLGTSQ
jgi:hypothetical protein